MLKILEGESLLNDASALLIYRIAVGTAADRAFQMEPFAPSVTLAWPEAWSPAICSAGFRCR